MKFCPVWINRDWKAGSDAALYEPDGLYSTADEGAMISAVLRGIDELGAYPGSGRILDYGSGTGAFAQAIDAEAYDPLTHPDMPDGTFDFITCIHVIEHAQDPIQLLRELKARLVPGGMVCIVSPNAVLWPSKRTRIPCHRWIFGRELVQLIEAEGFNVTGRLTWGGCTAKAKWIKEPINWMRKRLGIGDVQMIIARANNG